MSCQQLLLREVQEQKAGGQSDFAVQTESKAESNALQKKKKKRITFNKALHVKFEPLGSYTNTFVPVSFWYALAADLWEEVSCRHKIKFNCLEI